MSFPNIPDINTNINITFDDAINLLLTSIAMEEISLSKMLDAETEKILYVLENSTDCDGENDYSLQDVIAVNKSVNETIKNMIKLQMLLQFKLENIKEILPCTSTCSTTTASSTTTTTTCTQTTTTKSVSHTTTASTSTASTTTALAAISAAVTGTRTTTSVSTTTTTTTICTEYLAIFSAAPICLTSLRRVYDTRESILEREE